MTRKNRIRRYQFKFNHQAGIAMLALVGVIALLISALFIDSLSSNDFRRLQSEKTGQVLAEAKRTLIGYVVGDATKPGQFLCPDTNNDGLSDSCTNTTGLIGRLPWKKLAVTNMRDGAGECLWYALSPIYRNTINVRTLGNQLNLNTIGAITIRNASGVVVASNVIAVIMAPNVSINGQDRSTVGSSVCSGSNDASQYLETLSGVNNATGNFDGTNFTFVIDDETELFNDRLIWITRDDLYKTLIKRMIREMMGMPSANNGIYDYYEDSSPSRFPCPTDTVTGGQQVDGLGNCLLTDGFVPYNDLSFDIGDWQMDNGWFNLAQYHYQTNNNVTLTLTNGVYAASCTANSTIINCN